MLTALIISIAFILLFILFVFNLKANKENSKYCYEMQKDWKEIQEKHEEYAIRCETNKAVRRVYNICGDIIHHLDAIVGKDVGYMELAKELGGYARAIGSEDKPLSIIEHSVLANKDYLFPQLNKEQSTELLEFLTDINEEKRTPDSLLKLISGLIFWDSFDKALTVAKESNSKQTKNKEN